jgi:hypothetical protein
VFARGEVLLRAFAGALAEEQTPLHQFVTRLARLLEDDDSLPDEAEALYCRPLKSASQARHAPQPGRWQSRDDEYEYDSTRFPSIPDLIQGSSTLI